MANPIRHFELMVNDTEKTKEFYRRIFDWRFDTTDPSYTMIETGTAPAGGLMKRPPQSGPPSLNIYFGVDAIDPVLRNVVEAGGKVLVPRTEIPDMGWYAMFQDPDQIPVGLFEEKKAG